MNRRALLRSIVGAVTLAVGPAFGVRRNEPERELWHSDSPLDSMCNMIAESNGWGDESEWVIVHDGDGPSTTYPVIDVGGAIYHP